MRYSVAVERTLSKSAMPQKVQKPPNVFFFNVYLLVPPEMGAVAIESFRGNCASFLLKRSYIKTSPNLTRLATTALITENAISGRQSVASSALDP